MNLSTLTLLFPKVTGTTSMLGSIYVIQDVLRNPKKRQESSYHRVMVGLSTSDLINSFTWMLSSWPMPRGSRLFAVGTVGTCDATGFFLQVSSLCTPIYNCSLATFYLLQLKYSWGHSKMRRVDKWMHILPWIWAIIPGFAGLYAKSFGPYRNVCMPTDGYPYGCNDPNSTFECIRGGTNTFRIFGAWYVLTCFLSIGYVSVTMFRVYRSIATIEKNAEKYSFARYTSSSLSNRRMSMRVMIQGILYGAAIFLTVIFPLLNIFIFGTDNTPVLGTLTVIFTPWQGFFNALIYSIPIFQKFCRNHCSSDDNDRSFLGSLSDIWMRLKSLKIMEESRSALYSSSHKNTDSVKNQVECGKNNKNLSTDITKEETSTSVSKESNITKQVDFPFDPEKDANLSSEIPSSFSNQNIDVSRNFTKSSKRVSFKCLIDERITQVNEIQEAKDDIICLDDNELDEEMEDFPNIDPNNDDDYLRLSRQP